MLQLCSGAGAVLLCGYGFDGWAPDKKKAHNMKQLNSILRTGFTANLIFSFLQKIISNSGFHFRHFKTFGMLRSRSVTNFIS
jgi:hypothetical protein